MAADLADGRRLCVRGQSRRAAAGEGRHPFVVHGDGKSRRSGALHPATLPIRHPSEDIVVGLLHHEGDDFKWAKRLDVHEPMPPDAD